MYKAKVISASTAQTLTVEDLRLISDALDIVRPDTAKMIERARMLRNVFARMTED